MRPQDARSLTGAALHDLRTRVAAAVRRGMTQTEAARVFGVHRSAVNRWCRAAADGPDALRPRRRGRKPTGGPLAPNQDAILAEVVRTRHPDDLGLADALWTRDAVAAYAARRFGVARSRSVWGRWLRRQGFTPQRPARRAYRQDPADLTRWRAEVDPRLRARAKAEKAEVHWVDEGGVRTDHAPGTGYAPRGRTPVVRTAGRPARVNLLSTVTNAGKLRFRVFAGRFTAAVFLDFLRRLLRGVTGKVFLIADGHPVHRSRKVRAWVGRHAGRVRLFLPPPYRPELNPTELLNNAVKGTVPRVQRARDKAELAGQVRSYRRVAQKRADVIRRFFTAEAVSYAA